MDDDFQQRYRAAELAYAAGDYTEAGRIAGALLNELETTPEDPEAQIAAKGWRAFVALLLANVELYGLNMRNAPRIYTGWCSTTNPMKPSRDWPNRG